VTEQDHPRRRRFSRSDVPAPLKTAGRTASVAFGRLTAGARLLPAALMVGGQRCGTTALHRALMTHPLIAPPVLHKGVNYFDTNYYRDPAWYRGHFPLARLAERRTRGYGRPPIALESAGYYMFHPLAPARIAKDLPDARLIVMLRDPVERIHSAHKHETARGFETEPLERALELEDERLEGEVDRMLLDPRYASYAHRHHAYVRRGHYAEQVQNLFELFGRDQVHVMFSEEFLSDPEPHYKELLDFLDLPVVMPPSFDEWNARPGGSLDPALAERLRAHFAPHDRDLEDLLGRRLPWRTGG
jgi:hypothetical protein